MDEVAEDEVEVAENAMLRAKEASFAAPGDAGLKAIYDTKARDLFIVRKRFRLQEAAAGRRDRSVGGDAMPAGSGGPGSTSPF